MSEVSITLSALNKQIRNILDEGFPGAVWITAEILDMQVNRSGHCYMELIEKAVKDDTILAKNRATIWANKFGILLPFFETSTGTRLKPGIKILIKAEVIFHEIYGLSLNISDIDPSYTMGEMAMKRREVISRLRADGVMEMNKELTITSVPQTIAVISSETAAGYGDFLHSLVNNPYRFAFHIKLFPAIVQGDAAEKSIIGALEAIYRSDTDFDAVVLIRGGGSQADLDCFNSYELALHIAQFPLPVLTGIGHEKDETIADMVANRSLKTPTAVAEFLIDQLVEFEGYLSALQERFGVHVSLILKKETLFLEQWDMEIRHTSQKYLREKEYTLKSRNIRLVSSGNSRLAESRELLNMTTQRMQYQLKTNLLRYDAGVEQLERRQKQLVKNMLAVQHESLKSSARHLELVRPERVLARGYSITYHNGKAVTSQKDIAIDDLLVTRLAKGIVESRVERKEQKEIK